MQEKVSIWSSVVVARLPESRTCQHKREFTTAIRYKRILDLKTRISFQQAKIEGRSVELKIQAETLFIMEDEQGNLHPLSRRDAIKERIALADFLPQLDNGQELCYVAEIIDFYGDMVMQGQNLIIIYCLTFKLLALREQMVTLQPETIEEPVSVTLVQSEQVRSDSLIAENINLRRQLRVYETNLLNLKKSLQKAESINAELKRQIKLLQTGTAPQKPAAEFERFKRNDQKNETSKIIPLHSLEERRQNMGRRIKEFFINNA